MEPLCEESVDGERGQHRLNRGVSFFCLGVFFLAGIHTKKKKDNPFEILPQSKGISCFI